MIYNRIPIALGGLTKVKGPAINYQYDQKQILILTGLELPDYYTVDFCNDGDQQTKPMVGTADGVEIPDEFLLTGRPVKAYLIVTGEDDGAVETRYEIKLPVNQRPARTDITPTPAEQSTIDGLIEAMNQAVTDTEEAAEQAGQAVLHYPKVVNEYWYVWDVTAEDYVNTGYKATGSGTGISDAYLNADYTLTLEFTDGTSYTTPSIRGEPGPVGATPDFDIGTVTTGQPGTPASATITGTAAEPLLNLTIPKGDPGEVTQSEFDTAIGTINSALTSLSSVTEIIDTASGAIASFPDGSGLPIRSLVAEINPVQDLHGYANPWPAGGGVNKFDKDATGIVLNGYIDANYGQYKVATGGEKSFASGLLPAGTYTIKKVSCSRFRVGLFDTPTPAENANCIEFFSANPLTAESLTITTTAQGYLIIFCYNGSSETVTVDQILNSMHIVVGSTAPTDWTPYSNICPISGWTGLEGAVAGKNLFDKTAFTKSGWIVYAENPLRKMPIGTAVAFSINKIDSEAHGFSITVNSSVGSTAVATFAGYTFGNTVLTATINITQAIIDCPYIQLNGNWNGLTADMVEDAHFQMEINASPTAYEPYTGEPISVSFPSTVYGGTDEVVGGNGISTMGMVDLGSLTWGYDANSAQFYTNGIVSTSIVWNNWSNTPPLLCSRYKPVSNALLSSSDYCVGYAYNSAQIRVKDSGFTDVASFKTAMSGVQLCYELATPTTFTHTGQPVDTLVGQNNVWVDTGSVEVTYPADTKLYIDKKIAELAQ